MFYYVYYPGCCDYRSFIFYNIFCGSRFFHNEHVFILYLEKHVITK